MAAGQSSAQSQSSVADFQLGDEAAFVLSQDNIKAAVSLLLENRPSPSSSDVLEVTWSADGSTPWLGVPSPDCSLAGSENVAGFESFVMLAAELALDPLVQSKILKKENQIQRRCLSASDAHLSLCASDLDDWSTQHGASPDAVSEEADSVAGSDMLIVENEALREENATLKSELRRMGSLRIAPDNLEMLVSEPCEPADEATAESVVRDAVKRAVLRAAERAVPAVKPEPARRRAGAGRTHGVPRNVAVVTAAGLVFLLAILISKNPMRAKAAAVCAAAAIGSLLNRVPARHPSARQP